MWRRVAAIVLFVGLGAAENASAHATGDPYRLPVPLGLYLAAAAMAIALSFALAAYFVASGNPPPPPLERDVSARFLWARRPLVKRLLATVSIAALTTAIAAGFWGTPLSRENWAPLYFWSLLLLGMAYACAALGNVWHSVNPWRLLCGVVEFVTRRPMTPLLPFPSGVAYLPALAWLLVIVWMELVSVHPGEPRFVATFLVHYTWITLLGAFLFGKETWLRNAEVFGAFFGLMALLSPLRHEAGSTYARRPFAGLFRHRLDALSLLAFVIVLLAATAADGFTGTSLSGALGTVLAGFLGKEDGLSLRMERAFLILVTCALFGGLYLAAVGAKRSLMDQKGAFREELLRFAPALLPILGAYHVAHYWPQFASQLTVLPNILSDPFGRGWMFPGPWDPPNAAVPMNAAFVWYSQVAALLVGHVVGVYHSHIASMGRFSRRRDAIVAQLPMLMLMIVYTVTGLWSLAQQQTVEG